MKSLKSRLDMEFLEDRTTPTAALDALVASGSIMPDRINVTTVATTNNPATAAALATAPFADSVRSLGFGVYSVRLKPGTDLGGALAYYGPVAGVLAAETDQIRQFQARPNDTNYNLQYGMNRIGAPAAWDTTPGSTKFVVGIIDSGMDYTHRDLAQNVWLNQGEIPASVRPRLTDVDGDGLITFRDLNNPINIGAGKITDLNGNGYIDGGDVLKSTSSGGWADGTDTDENGFADDFIGWDFANYDNDPFDEVEHGTHVSGIVGAVGNNKTGVTGVNWTTQMIAIKAGGNGLASSDIIASINYSILVGARVTNNSYGGFGPAQIGETRAIAATQAAGQIFVAAAGNSGVDNDIFPFYPTNYAQTFDNVISVAATDSNDQLASFSQFGAQSVTLGAPGVGIYSTRPFNQYQYLDGTSMASPMVAGAIALYWGAYPNLTYQQVVTKLKDSVDQTPAMAGNATTNGRLNVGRMFALTTTAPVTPVAALPPVVVNAPFGTDIVRVLGPGGVTKFALRPNPGYLGGIVAAAADATGDGVADVATAAAFGGHVKLFDGANGRELRSFYAFPGYTGAISLAVADLTGDGKADLIVSANLNGHVKVFDGVTNATVFSAKLYDGYFGPVAVAAADVNGDGKLDLVVGANGGAGVHVKEYLGLTGNMVKSFKATGAGTTQFSLSAGDLNGDGIAELLVSQGNTVNVLDMTNDRTKSYLVPFDANTNTKITIQAANYTGDPYADLVAIAEVPSTPTTSHVKAFHGLGLSLVDSFIAGTR